MNEKAGRVSVEMHATKGIVRNAPGTFPRLSWRELSPGGVRSRRNLVPDTFLTTALLTLAAAPCLPCPDRPNLLPIQYAQITALVILLPHFVGKYFP